MRSEAQRKKINSIKRAEQLYCDGVIDLRELSLYKNPSEKNKRRFRRIDTIKRVNIINHFRNMFDTKESFELEVSNG